MIQTLIIGTNITVLRLSNVLKQILVSLIEISNYIVIGTDFQLYVQILQAIPREVSNYTVTSPTWSQKVFHLQLTGVILKNQFVQLKKR